MQQPVKVLPGRAGNTGYLLRGIDTEGNMLLQDKDGVRKFVGGEISLRADH